MTKCQPALPGVALRDPPAAGSNQGLPRAIIISVPVAMGFNELVADTKSRPRKEPVGGL